MKALRTLKDLSYDPIEIKVREATNNDPIGASSTLMAEIAQATHNYRLYAKCYAMLWKRLCDLEHILHVQKALILVEYLLRNGHERFVNDCKKNSRDIVRLTKYKYYNKDHEDIAHDVRFKAAIVADLLNNNEKLGTERKKAEGMRGIRLQAVSHEDVNYNAKTVENQWSSIDREKQAKEAAAKRDAERARAARARPAKQAEPADEGEDSDGEPAGTVNLDDDPFGNPPADPEPVKKKPAAKKKAAAPAAAPAPAPVDDDEETGPRRPSGDDFAVRAPAPAAAPQPRRAAAPVAAPVATAPVVYAQPQPQPQPVQQQHADPFNIFDVGINGSSAPKPVQQNDNVDLLTTSFTNANMNGGSAFVDVPAAKPKNASPAPVKGQSNVDVPAARPNGGAGNELWNIDGLVSVDDLTGARKKDESKKPVGAGVSMGEMNQLKQGLGANAFLDGFGGSQPIQSQPNPYGNGGMRASASAPNNGNNNLLQNNPFFAPAPQQQQSPFQGLPASGYGGAQPQQQQQRKPVAAQPAAGGAGSNPFADLGFG